MSYFEEFFQIVLKHEGHFSNDPQDSGGPTIYGITHSEVSRYIGHEATIDEVKNFPLESAKEIYRKNYWDKMRCDEITSRKRALIIADQAVNRGCGGVCMDIQKMYNLIITAKMDNSTLHKINSSDKFEMDFFKLCQLKYIDIVKRKPSQIVFLKGWINRTHKLLDIINEK